MSLRNPTPSERCHSKPKNTALDQAHACFEGIALQSDAQVLVIIAQRAEAMEGEPEGRTHRLLVHLASVATAAMGEVRDPRLNLL